MKLAMENKLKDEYFKFFWIRLLIGLIIGLIFFLFSKLGLLPENNFLSNSFNMILGYMIPSNILRKMINRDKSALYMVFNQKNNNEMLGRLDFMKIYWSFYWRETIISLVVCVLIFFAYYIMIRIINLSYITLLSFICFIAYFISIYYIGRSVFKDVISNVSWKLGRIEVKLDD